MFGKNPILPPKKGDGSSLDVHKIFPTFQGEGPFVGHRAVFVRLSGCNLACEFCDTEFDSFNEMTIEEITNQVTKLCQDEQGKRVCNLVVITGGEPFRQPIEKFCQKLIDNGLTVQIETNGLIYRDLPKAVKIVCSPKNNGKGYQAIRPDLLARIDALKFLISANNHNYQQVPQIGQHQFNIPVYVQPMDEYDKKKNLQNRQLTLDIASKYGYILCLQTHKFWDIE